MANLPLSKPELAARWGIDLRMLYRYLNASATPTIEVFGKLAGVPELELTLGGKRLKPTDLITARRPQGGGPVQLDLDFDEEVVLRVGEREIAISVSRKPDGKVFLSVGVAQPA